MQGLSARSGRRSPQVEAPKLREVFVPAQEIAAGTIIGPDGLPVMEITEAAITEPDGRRGRGRRGLPRRQRRPPGPAARRSDRPVRHRAAGRSRISRRRAAARQARGDDPDQRGRRAERPGASRRPGRHPDLSIAGSAIRVGGIRASETVLENVRLLALDQRLGPVKTEETKGKKSDATPVAKTATLEVTPREAEIIALAATWAACRSRSTRCATAATTTAGNRGHGRRSQVRPRRPNRCRRAG